MGLAYSAYVLGGILGFVMAWHLSFVRFGLKATAGWFATGFLGLVGGGLLGSLFTLVLWPPFNWVTALTVSLAMVSIWALAVGVPRMKREVNRIDFDHYDSSDNAGVGS